MRRSPASSWSRFLFYSGASNLAHVLVQSRQTDHTADLIRTDHPRRSGARLLIGYKFPARPAEHSPDAPTQRSKDYAFESLLLELYDNEVRYTSRSTDE